MESLVNSEYFASSKQAKNALKKRNKATNTDINYNELNGEQMVTGQHQDLMSEDDVGGSGGEETFAGEKTLPVYSITLKTPSLRRRPKSTTFSDWRGQISAPRSAGRKSGIRLMMSGSVSGGGYGENSPVKRPKSTSFFDIKIDNLQNRDEENGEIDVKVRRRKKWVIFFCFGMGKNLI